LITVFVHADGKTSSADRVDPAWLAAGSSVKIWVDLMNPSREEGEGLLRNVFHFHDLAVEDAMSALEYPKVESYGDYLYVILHRIDFAAPEHCFQTHDVDFFLGPNYLVTIHTGDSRRVAVDRQDRQRLQPRRPDPRRRTGHAALSHRRHDGGQLPA
jgi:magnesium transporter